jgi:hypothetical protein
LFIWHLMFSSKITALIRQFTSAEEYGCLKKVEFEPHQFSYIETYNYQPVLMWMVKIYCSSSNY